MSLELEAASCVWTAGDGFTLSVYAGVVEKLSLEDQMQ